jgi:phosphatidylinositol alpha-1,6-mannosyltransferase
VQFRGVASDEELLECYQQCDLFALPNRQVGWDFEGFGIVLLEAQACGRPVVTGISGGTVEAIDAGRSGLAVDCADPDELCAAVSTVLSDGALAARMGEHGRRWTCDRFEWSVSVGTAMQSFAERGDVEARSA